MALLLWLIAPVPWLCPLLLWPVVEVCLSGLYAACEGLNSHRYMLVREQDAPHALESGYADSPVIQARSGSWSQRPSFSWHELSPEALHSLRKDLQRGLTFACEKRRVLETCCVRQAYTLVAE